MPYKGWRQVVVSRMVSVEEGYLGAADAVVSKEFPLDGRLVSFVRINKNSIWLLNICGGKAARKGGLRRTRAIEELRSLCEIKN